MPSGASRACNSKWKLSAANLESASLAAQGGEAAQRRECVTALSWRRWLLPHALLRGASAPVAAAAAPPSARPEVLRRAHGMQLSGGRMVAP